MNKDLQQEGWTETALGEIAEIITGKTPSTSNQEYYGAIYPFITPTDIEDGNLYCESERFLSEKGRSVQNSLLLPPNSICYTCIASIGKICLTTQYSFTNQQINSLIIKDGKADHRYIFYVLKYSTNKLKQIAGGTTTKIINKTQFANFSISLPPLPEQRAIAAVLSSLDDKIELLREQNKTLEAIAQNLFHEWFVEFNFPNDVGKPYKKSGGKMVDGELGEMPEGWSSGALSDIAKIDWGNTSLTKKSYAESGEFLGVSAAGCDGRMRMKEYDFGTVVISAIGEYCGKTYLPMEDFTAIKNTLVVRQINEKYSYFAYLGLRIWSLHRRGAAQPFLSKGDTEKFSIIVPTKDVLTAFENLVDALFQKMRSNSNQINSFSALRDALLPRMMSGEVRVKLP